MKRIVFLTGTRADYGKLKSLMKKVQQNKEFELNIFATGMHMLSKYGSTYKEIEKDNFKNIYKFINQNKSTSMDITLSNTILGLSNYISEVKPELIVIHGDRLEALAGAIVGAFNNIKVMHIEGGEVSGTIDDSIRHAITKLSHYHLVANEEAKRRIVQLGEKKEDVFIFGSPDIDIMYSDKLPTLEEAKKYYNICFDKYSIFMYHPVTTEVDYLETKISEVVETIIKSNKNYLVIYPNNDEGSDIILKQYEKFIGNDRFRIFPSMRFEYFLTLLKNSDFIIGNSSSGIREACVYGIPSIDIGNRQQGRYDVEKLKNIQHVNEVEEDILDAISHIHKIEKLKLSYFGNGKSDEIFIQILNNKNIWDDNYQKKFVDIDF